MGKQILIDLVKQVRAILVEAEVKFIAELPYEDRVTIFDAVKAANLPLLHELERGEMDYLHVTIQLRDFGLPDGEWGFTTDGAINAYNAECYDEMWVDIPHDEANNVSALDALLSYLRRTAGSHGSIDFCKRCDKKIADIEYDDEDEKEKGHCYSCSTELQANSRP